MRRTAFSAFTLLAVALLLAACGSSSKGSQPTQTSARTATTVPLGTTVAAPTNGAAVVIESGPSGFKFTTSPAKAGATVTIKNTTSVQHTVTADTTAGGFDVTVDPGKSMTFTAPSKPGVYKFHCNIHTYMTGALTVT